MDAAWICIIIAETASPVEKRPAGEYGGEEKTQN